MILLSFDIELRYVAYMYTVMSDFRNATEELKDVPVTINDFDRLVEACVKEESPILDDIKHEIRDGRYH